MTWLLVGLGAYFAWQALLARERRAFRAHAAWAQRAAAREQQYRPPPVVYGTEPVEPMPRYPAGHAPVSARRDIAGDQEVFLCSCGARVLVTRHDLALASKPRRAIEDAFLRHAAEYEACAVAANGRRP